ncbi:hypothetical protein P9747_07320, partial [Paenibacillus macerans]|uniref:hypothetical protein n=1 Tax=Paenibacillus macerans TaxID=44252 RepID=UPI002E217C1A|nr:hypothetical protein [Paenibacillus macerans]
IASCDGSIQIANSVSELTHSLVSFESSTLNLILENWITKRNLRFRTILLAELVSKQVKILVV